MNHDITSVDNNNTVPPLLFSSGELSNRVLRQLSIAFCHIISNLEGHGDRSLLTLSPSSFLSLSDPSLFTLFLLLLVKLFFFEPEGASNGDLRDVDKGEGRGSAEKEVTSLSTTSAVLCYNRIGGSMLLHCSSTSQ